MREHQLIFSPAEFRGEHWRQKPEDSPGVGAHVRSRHPRRHLHPSWRLHARLLTVRLHRQVCQIEVLYKNLF